jgi:hypothetical protein
MNLEHQPRFWDYTIMEAIEAVMDESTGPLTTNEVIDRVWVMHHPQQRVFVRDEATKSLKLLRRRGVVSKTSNGVYERVLDE